MNNKELKLINGQLIGIFLFIICLVISYLIVYNEKLKLLGKKEIFTNIESLNISLINRMVFVLLGVYFVYNAIESKELHNENANLQILASILALSASIVILYIILDNYNKYQEKTFDKL